MTADRNQGFTVWLTGLSGAGKSTIALLLQERFRRLGRNAEVLDGDAVRTQLSKGLGFSKGERDENIRRIGFVSELLSRNGVVTIVAAISPYRSVRDEVRLRIDKFIEVYLECPLEILVARDVKGLYKQAMEGKIAQFTGVCDPYEPPLRPEVHLYTETQTPKESLEIVWAELGKRGLITAASRPTSLGAAELQLR